MILKAEGKTLLLTAVSPTLGEFNIFSLDSFNLFFEEEKLLCDRTLLLVDLNFSLKKINDASTLWKLLMAVF